jgi:hypothetical protein
MMHFLGLAYIELKSQQEAEAATAKYHKKMFGSRYINVKLSSRSKLDKEKATYPYDT